MQFTLRPTVAWAATGILILVAACLFSLKLIHDQAREFAASHLRASLDKTEPLLARWGETHAQESRVLASQPEMAKPVIALLDEPSAERRQQMFERLDAHWQSAYVALGFSGLSVWTVDGVAVGASRKYIVGENATGDVRAVLARAALRDGAVSRPIRSEHPMTRRDGTIAQAGALYQLACAAVRDAHSLHGYICLRMDAEQMFSNLLAIGRVGNTGQVYAINAAGLLISPSRFNTSPGERDKVVWARVPGAVQAKGGMTHKPTDPLTSMAAGVIRSGQAELFDGYVGYRGEEVLGAGRWLDDMHMGLIVEEDTSEVYSAYRLARNVILLMTGLAIALLVFLTWASQRSRRQILSREVRFTSLIRNFPAAISVRDAAGRYLVANPYTQQLLGLSSRDMIGRHCEDLLPPAPAAEMRKLDRQVFETGEVLDTMTQESGDRRYRVIRFPIPGSGGTDVEAVGVVAIDVTEQLQTTERLRELTDDLETVVKVRTAELAAAKEQAEMASQAKADFLANMSHEIRTPMNAMIGLSHLALQQQASPRARQYLERIRDSGQHLLGIVNDILDFSKIEAGELALNESDFALDQLVDHVISLVWEKAYDKGLEVLIQIDPDVPLGLVGDRLRIGQILINFVNNAVKFTPHGEVAIHIRVIDEIGQRLRVRFEVRDTGIGIPAHRRGALFKPFQQLDSSLAFNAEGTGLGLVISKRFAEAMGGHVGVESTVGVGSTFWLELDLQESEVRLPEHVQTFEAAGRSVLVVDDNSSARRTLATMLRSMAFYVGEARSGEEAIQAILAADRAGRPYEFVFIDWKMPGMDGPAVAGRIRDLGLQGSHPLLIALHPGRGGEVIDMPLSFSAVIDKPVTSSALLETLHTLIFPSYGDPLPGALGGAWGPISEDFGSLRGLKVLLAEDNEVNQEVAVDLLSVAGVEVSIAKDGHAAVALASTGRFDVVLMDLHMPVLDGIDAAAHIRAQQALSTLPVIALTASAHTAIREKCLAMGMNDFITKPIDPHLLFTTLRKWDRRFDVAEEPADIAAAPAVVAGDDIPHIDGLDVDGALARLMGRKPTYLKLLRKFSADYPDIARRIADAKARGDTVLAARLAHSIKSVAATLGAETLRALSARLEEGLAVGADIGLDLVGFNAEVERLTAAILAALPPAEACAG
ncbi:response regulator [Jeongeupia naejangsanensis]|uniref:histidine kinase n=1 Tax=Jeongeupia naejangsanensis TaxID=613195 RepID=A0ABS2BGJ4_9NEIS|nr:response regulator [Jeongeupia naejangsanensis]MBM3114733.1 response regulator [Jeongeupia naejangsanensis]